MSKLQVLKDFKSAFVNIIKLKKNVFNQSSYFILKNNNNLF